MKSMNNDNSSNNNNNNSNWLGFSLSPHMNMEAPNSQSQQHHHHQTQQPPSTSVVSTALPTTYFHSPSSSHINYSSICYGSVEGENGGFYSPLSVMPLKSDGSLCIMEALTRSQPQGMVTTSTPKLEDFFGGATMGTHQYESNGREAMALSLDSMYYHQTSEHESNSHNFLNNLQHNSRQQQQQQQQIEAQYYPFYTGYRSPEIFQTPLEEQNKETQVADCNVQQPAIADDGTSGMKNWVSRNYPANPTLEQKRIGCMGDNGGESGSVGAMGYGDLQSLSLSMSPGSQSSCVTGSQQISPSVTDCVAMDARKRGSDKVDQKQIVHRKSIDTFGQRTSQYRGVTRHRWTGRYEAHLWDNSCKKEGQSRKGRQVYLGGYDMEEKAARAYDQAALKYWGPSTHINFPLENYQEALEGMKNMSRQEYVAHLRRKSSGFSRGASMYRGVTRHHQHGRWQARIGRVAGNKDLYLGTFSTQEEAAEAYDVAAIKFRGVNAVTNFDITRYDVERIMASNTLLAGELARRNKDIVPTNEASNHNPSTHNVGGGAMITQEKNQSDSNWKMALYQSSQQPTTSVKRLDQKSVGLENFKSPSFSLAPHDMIAIDTMSSAQLEVEDSTKMGTQYLSNASSLVTSLSSSREGSPDKSSIPMLFAMPSSTTKFFTNQSSNMNTWIPATQLRPAISLPHVPVFAAWTDA